MIDLQNCSNLLWIALSLFGIGMAIHIASPWGDILGKLGDAVGGKWRGIYWVRKLVFPTQRGTLPLYRLLKQGMISPDRFSFKQMNLRRASLQVLGYVGRTNLELFINLVWEKFCKQHGYRMTGTNCFVNRNASTLYHSMPHIEQEYEVGINEPDLKVLKMSDGDLEGTPILTGTYTTGTGILEVTWDKTCYTNGTQGDIAHIVVLKKPILESVGETGTWAPKLYMYGPFYGQPPATVRLRSHELMQVTLPTGLSAADLTVFLFFRDTSKIIGYSISNSFQVTTP